MKKLLVIGLLALSLSACQYSGYDERESNLKCSNGSHLWVDARDSSHVACFRDSDQQEPQEPSQ